MEAKLSNYQSGSPRFGYRDPEPFDHSVKRSYLSQEELEEYRNGKKGGSKYMLEADYLKRKEEGRSNRQIADEYGISEGTLYNRIKMWKRNKHQKDVQAHTEEIKQSEANCSGENKNDKLDEYESLISELKTELLYNKDLVDVLKEKIAKYENAACEDVENEIATLKEENELLNSQKVETDYIIENQKHQLGQYAKQNEELSEEIEHLKYFANRYLAV